MEFHLGKRISIVLLCGGSIKQVQKQIFQYFVGGVFFTMCEVTPFCRCTCKQGKSDLKYRVCNLTVRVCMQVAEARRLPVEDVRKIAKGRMWSGVDALALGLVDQLGGLQDAIRLAKELAHLPLVCAPHDCVAAIGASS